MKKAESFTGILAALFFAVMGALYFVLPDREMSELENRYLQQRPELSADSLLSGRWGEQVEAYLTDQFPLREGFVGAASYVQRYALQKKELGGIYPRGNLLIPAPDEPMAVFERNISALLRLCGWADAPVTVLPPVTAASIMADELPLWSPQSPEGGIISSLRGALGGERVLDISGRLAAAYDAGQKVYFSTDHHWTMRGAYEAYAAYIEACGMTPLPLADFDAVSVTGDFRGTSYAKAALWGVAAEDITLLVPSGGYDAVLINGTQGEGAPLFDEGKLLTYDKYAYFLGGNQPLQTIKSGAGTGRSLVMIKDSYAHILAPMLSLHFDAITLIDPRYIGGSPYELIEAAAPTDILVLMNAENIAQENGLTLFLRYSPEK